MNNSDLKKEHSELKERLLELLDFINSEEYYKLSDGEKNLISQQRTGMELYLSTLTRRIYGNPDSQDGGNLMWLTMLYGMFSTSPFNYNTKAADDLKKALDEDSKKKGV